MVNAAGCGSNLKDFAHQLRDEPGWAERAVRCRRRSRDVSELLDELGPVAERHPLAMTVAYQDACHLGHAQGVRAQPRRLLRGIPGVELRELREAEICCGSAGTYNLLHPEPARELGERKANAVLATGAQVMVTANPGCWMQVATTLARHGQAATGRAHRAGAGRRDPRGAGRTAAGAGTRRPGDGHGATGDQKGLAHYLANNRRA